ncbi:MAG TPA: AAA family ATPase [Ilumatobacter sp.]|nr:AAA family ATPase [Ilumatobacter sp.]
MSGSPPHSNNTSSTSTAATVLDVHGPARLWHAGAEIALRPKERALLAALALARPRPATHDEIVDLLWEQRPPPTARKSIHNHVARLRQAVDSAIVTSPGGYALAESVELVPWRAGAGEPFADLADTATVAVARAHALAVAEAAEDAALESAVRTDAPDAVARLREALAQQPLDERRWWLLALQLARHGRRRDALLAFHDARLQLAEAGLLPTEQLLALESLIVTGDTRLSRPDGIAELLDDTLGRPARSGEVHHHTVPTIHPHGDDPFVGRRSELDLLAVSWAEAQARGPVLAIVTAPAGMGKTRLVDEFVRQAHVQGPEPNVLLGRGRATADQAFGMLAESFADLQAGGPDDGLAPTRLAQALRQRLGALLDTPTVWCIDDVQWVGADAIGVLDAALDGLRGPLLVVATVRTGEHPGTAALGTLAGKLTTHHLELAPLTVGDVGNLLGQGDDRPADPHLADLVHARTGGLALFASEIARAARRGHDPIDPAEVPAALRDWIGARRAALLPDTAELLDMAAVLGERFDADLLAQAVTGDTATSGHRVARACDALIDAGLLQPAGSGLGGAVELAFAHAITHEIVYGQIGPTTRAQLHLQAAQTIERLADRRGGARDHAALAYHYGQAGAPGRTAAARESRLAGDAAYAMGAWEAAGAHYRVAFGSCDDDAQRAELLVGVGRAELRAGRHEPAAAALAAAVELARPLGLALVEARATLELVGRAGRGAAVGAGDAEHERLLRRAIDALERYRPTDADSERAHTVAMSALERELAFVLLLGESAERTDLFNRSLKRARALEPPDEAALASALLGARYAKLAGHQLGERLADIDEVLGATRAKVGDATVLAALCYRIEDLLRAGRLGAVADALDDAELMLRQHPDPYWRWSVRAWRAVHAIAIGDLDEAEALADHAAALRPGVPEAAACLVVNRVNIGLYRGRAADFVPAVDAACAMFPNVPAYRAVLALCLTRSGTDAARQRARSELAALGADGFATLPDDVNRFFALGVLAHAAADLGDRDAAAALTPLLQPYSGQWVVVMAYGAGGAVWGPVDHALALLAQVCGDTARATELFDRAEREAVLAPLVLAQIAADRVT